MLLDLDYIKLFIFVDRLFANNKDISLQIRYKIILANKLYRDNSFTITRNLIYQSSTKSKRVIRSILASEIYKIIIRVDIAIVINSTISLIIGQLNLRILLIIIYTDLYSLYKCLVKLGTIKEKRLIIDIIALRQLYK